MKNSKTALCITILGMSTCLYANNNSAQNNKPNIIYILADDRDMEIWDATDKRLKHLI